MENIGYPKVLVKRRKHNSTYTNAATNLRNLQVSKELNQATERGKERGRGQFQLSLAVFTEERIQTRRLARGSC